MRNHLSTLALLLLLGGLAPGAVHSQSAPPSAALVINEIQYAPSPSQNEFIELYNRSPQTVDLRDVAFSDERAMPLPITDTSTPIPPDEYAVLVRNPELFAAAFPDVPFVVPDGWAALNNSGDAVILYANDTVIDRVPYAPDWGGREGTSLERIDPNGPSDSAANFGSSTAPEGATPGRINSLFAPDLTPPAVLFAEVVRTDTVRAVFSEPVRAAPPAAFTLDDGRTPTRVRPNDNARRLNLGFAASVTGRRLRIEGVTDRVGNVLRDTSVFLAYPPDAGDIVISEVMYAPTADDFDGRPNQPEYFELANRTDRALSLRGAFWTDRPNEMGAADTTRIDTGPSLALAPTGRAVVYAEPDPSVPPATAGQLARAFPDIDFSPPAVTLLPIDGTSLGLLNTGDRIRLHRADETVLDAVDYTPDWHAAALADTRGVALERMSLRAPSNDAANWSSSVAPAGGTPGHPNSVRLPPTPPATNMLTVAPSPFSPDGDGFEDATRIEFVLDAEIASIRVRIYDAAGRLVRTLDENRPVGRTGVILWDGRDDRNQPLRVGLYVVLFEALAPTGGQVITLKRPVVLARPLN